MLVHKRSNKSGFTLVEIAVVAPIVILVIGTFIFAVIKMTGDVMATRAADILANDIQDSLNKIDYDMKIGGVYLNTSITPSPPQGSSNDATAFLTTITNGTATNNLPLIINTYATTDNPLATTKNLVYKNPSSCTNATTPMMFNTVYFVDSNKILWRRTIAPTDYNNGCDASTKTAITPWQLPSCAPSITGAICKAQDTKLVSGIEDSGFIINYGKIGTVDKPGAITVKITSTSKVAGRDITQSGTVSTFSLNN